MFVVKNDDGRNDHTRYKSIYFNYFFTCYYRVRLFLAMQVRVMAACMESQADILECTATLEFYCIILRRLGHKYTGLIV